MAANNASVQLPNASVPLWVQYQGQLTVWYHVMVSISVLGVVFNTILIIAILSNTKNHTRSGILVVHLVILITILSGINMPIVYTTMYNVIRVGLPSVTFCRWTSLLYFTVSYAANWADLAIGMNRFIAIFLPHRYAALSGRKGSFVMILVPWLIGFALTIYIFLDFGATFMSTPPWGACGLKAFLGSAYPITSNLGMALPVVLQLVIYGAIFCYIRYRTTRKRKVAAAEISTGGSDRILKRRFRSVKRLFLAYLWYSVCLLPAPIATSLFPREYSSQPLLQLILRAVLLFGYSTVSMIILLSNVEYRRRLHSIAKASVEWLGILPSRDGPSTARTKAAQPSA